MNTTHDSHDDFVLDALYRAEAQQADGEQAESTPSPTLFHFPSYLTGLLTALILVGATTVLLRQADPAPLVLQAPPTPAPTATATPTATPPPLVIFVSGAVQQPGMYSVAPDGRVGDALRAAGGLTLQANVALVNQAERLWDGAQVHVPAITAAALEPVAEEVSAPAPEPVTPPAGLSSSALNPNGRTALTGASNLININLASPAQLETLPGIGASKAAAIVANRPYTTIDDLERVPGIGAKTVEQLRPLVTVN